MLTGIGSAPLICYGETSLRSSVSSEPVSNCSFPLDSGLSGSYVKVYNGKPTMFTGNHPSFPMAYISYYPEQSRYEKMYQSGTRFFSLSITLGDGFYGAYRNGKVRLDKKGVWDAPGTIDYTLIEIGRAHV